MFRVVFTLIISSAYNSIYSIWYLSHRYCFLPLSWKSLNLLECTVGGVRHPQHHMFNHSYTEPRITETMPGKVVFGDGLLLTRFEIKKQSKICPRRLFIDSLLVKEKNIFLGSIKQMKCVINTSLHPVRCKL
jgi:hypothetical protein